MTRRQWHPTPVLLPGKSHGWRSLVGCSPWGREESDMTERLHFDLSLSCIGEGNGNPLQYSCLENPRDGGALWAAVYGVAQSWTRLKWLSSSSGSKAIIIIFVNIYWTILIIFSSKEHLLCFRPKLNILLIHKPKLIPGSGKSPREGSGNPLWYSCLGNPMNKGAWQATVHWVAKSWTQFSN